jgi:hypothetical protein
MRITSQFGLPPFSLLLSYISSRIWRIGDQSIKFDTCDNRDLFCFALSPSSKVSSLIDWMPIRRILDEMYDNKSEKGGRPNCDVILMFKILILQQWYGLNDLEVEIQMADRISFMSFLGFPDPFPDSRTIWLFKERMANTGKDKMVWAELQRQLDAMGPSIRRGHHLGYRADRS